jgi:hypothetical protein
MNLPTRRLSGAAVVLGLAALAVVPSAQAASATGSTPAAGTATTRALALLPAKITAGLDIRVAKRRYALCAASNITPSSKSIIINSRKYQVGTGVCPIVTGWTVYNKSLQGTGTTPKGASTIWSSFGSPAALAQYNPTTGWTVAAPQGGLVTEGSPGNSGMANFWGFPCVVTTPVNIGGTNYPMAMCAGPLMENIDNRPVAPGSSIYTDNPTANIPVGYGKPLVGQLAGMDSFFMNPFPAS